MCHFTVFFGNQWIRTRIKCYFEDSESDCNRAFIEIFRLGILWLLAYFFTEIISDFIKFWAWSWSSMYSTVHVMSIGCISLLALRTHVHLLIQGCWMLISRDQDIWQQSHFCFQKLSILIDNLGKLFVENLLTILLLSKFEQWATLFSGGPFLNP